MSGITNPYCMTVTTQRETYALYVMGCYLNTKWSVPEGVVGVDVGAGISVVVVVVVAAAAPVVATSTGVNVVICEDAT